MYAGFFFSSRRRHTRCALVLEFRRVLFRSRVAIIAITTIPSRRRRDQTDLLIVADHPLRDPTRARCTANVHSVTRLRRSALATTLTEEDRKSVVLGKSVSVRVDLGGRRIITKKPQIYHTTSLN